MKIAVAGRGGSGKTTLAGTLARVLAIPYQDMMARYSVPAADHTRLLLMGRVDRGGAG